MYDKITKREWVRSLWRWEDKKETSMNEKENHEGNFRNREMFETNNLVFSYSVKKESALLWFVCHELNLNLFLCQSKESFGVYNSKKICQHHNCHGFIIIVLYVSFLWNCCSCLITTNPPIHLHHLQNHLKILSVINWIIFKIFTLSAFITFDSWSTQKVFSYLTFSFEFQNYNWTYIWNVVSSEICVALYNYTANNSNELTFKKGDKIRYHSSFCHTFWLRKKIILFYFRVLKREGEWLEGELNGSRGWFPMSFVELLNPDLQSKKTTRNCNSFLLLFFFHLYNFWFHSQDPRFFFSEHQWRGWVNCHSANSNQKYTHHVSCSTWNEQKRIQKETSREKYFGERYWLWLRNKQNYSIQHHFDLEFGLHTNKSHSHAPNDCCFLLFRQKQREKTIEKFNSTEC